MNKSWHAYIYILHLWTSLAHISPLKCLALEQVSWSKVNVIVDVLWNSFPGVLLWHWSYLAYLAHASHNQSVVVIDCAVTWNLGPRPKIKVITDFCNIIVQRILSFLLAISVIFFPPLQLSDCWTNEVKIFFFKIIVLSKSMVFYECFYLNRDLWDDYHLTGV